MAPKGKGKRVEASVPAAAKGKNRAVILYEREKPDGKAGKHRGNEGSPKRQKVQQERVPQASPLLDAVQKAIDESGQSGSSRKTAVVGMSPVQATPIARASSANLVINPEDLFRTPNTGSRRRQRLPMDKNITALVRTGHLLLVEESHGKVVELLEDVILELIQDNRMPTLQITSLVKFLAFADRSRVDPLLASFPTCTLPDRNSNIFPSRKAWLMTHADGNTLAASMSSQRSKVLFVVRQAIRDEWVKIRDEEQTETRLESGQSDSESCAFDAMAVFQTEGWDRVLGNFAMYKYATRCSGTRGNMERGGHDETQETPMVGGATSQEDPERLRSLLATILRLLYAGGQAFYGSCRKTGNKSHVEPGWNVFPTAFSVEDMLLYRAPPKASEAENNPTETRVRVESDALMSLKQRVSVHVEMFVTMVLYFIMVCARSEPSRLDELHAIKALTVMDELQLREEKSSDRDNLDTPRGTENQSGQKFRKGKRSSLEFPFNAECVFTRLAGGFYKSSLTEKKTSLDHVASTPSTVGEGGEPPSLVDHYTRRILRQRAKKDYQDLVRSVAPVIQEACKSRVEEGTKKRGRVPPEFTLFKPIGLPGITDDDSSDD